MRTVLAVAFVTVVASSALAQGVVLTMRETRGGQVSNTEVQIDQTHLRTQMRQGTDEMVVLFDGGEQVLRMINMSRKSYSEMTRAQAQQVGQQLGAMMAAMQAQLEKMPPEQRKMMEDVLKGRGGRGLPGMPGAQAPERMTYTRTGTSKAGQWPCTTYDGVRGAEKVVEVCAAEARDFTLSPADFQVTAQLLEFSRSLAPQMADLVADQIAVYGSVEQQGFAGFPVRRTTFRNGKPESVFEVVDVKRQAIPAAAFAVPTGFTKQDMMPGMLGGRGR